VTSSRRWDPALTRVLGVGLGLPALAFAAQDIIWPFIPPSPHLLFYPAVIGAARISGARAGVLATLTSLAAIAYGFLPPATSIAVDVPKDILNLVIFGSVGVFISMTIGRLRETAIRERAARIAADETWAMIAHDLRTPLSTIEMGSKQLANRLRMGGGELERAARVIERSSGRALSLLQDAVDTVKLNEGAFAVEPEACDVRELFAHVLDGTAPVAVRASVRLDSDVATKRSIVCDEPRIAQVLQNLTTNAIRFTPRGGSVTLVAEDDGDDVRIHVRDTGSGIAPGDLRFLFDKHWSKGSGGSGLGLWIARSIVEAHHRELEVTSHRGQGTDFSFRLPAVPDVREHPNEQSADEPRPTRPTA
jgi:signal transduction histidine kinase